MKAPDLPRIREALAWWNEEGPTTVFATRDEVMDELVDATRAYLDLRESMKTWPYCPICGRRNRDAATLPDLVDEMGETLANWTFCSPTNCDAWKVTATFDHATREWVTVSDDPEEAR